MLFYIETNSLDRVTTVQNSVTFSLQS